MAESCAALERALVHADACGERNLRRMVTASLAHALFDGPAPAAYAIDRCEKLLQGARGDRMLEAFVVSYLSAMIAMAGRLDEARKLAYRNSSLIEELDATSTSFLHRRAVAETKWLCGDLAGAEQELNVALGWFRDLRGDELDARAMYFSYELAHLYCEAWRWDDAERCLEYGREAPEPAFFRHEAVLRLAARARIAAHRGGLADALTFASRAVEQAEQSDLLGLRARVRLVLAEAQRRNGRPRDADAAVAEALRLFETKGNLAAAALHGVAHGPRTA